MGSHFKSKHSLFVLQEYGWKWNEMKWNEMKWNEMKWNIWLTVKFWGLNLSYKIISFHNTLRIYFQMFWISWQSQYLSTGVTFYLIHIIICFVLRKPSKMILYYSLYMFIYHNSVKINKLLHDFLDL
jgi:hypothetical protein